MKCKICDHATTGFSNPRLKKEYTLCSHCELISVEKAFIVSNESEKAQYDNHHNSLENLGYVQMFENFLDFFWDELTCKDISCLDFGSGPTPVLGELIQRRGAKVDCYDKFYQSEKIFTGKSYDVITSTEVFEHLENPLQILDFLTSHLKENGILAIMTLFHQNDKDLFLNWWYPRDPTHITFYTPKTLEILGEKCGLKVMKTDKTRVLIFKKVAVN